MSQRSLSGLAPARYAERFYRDYQGYCQCHAGIMNPDPYLAMTPNHQLLRLQAHSDIVSLSS